MIINLIKWSINQYFLTLFPYQVHQVQTELIFLLLGVDDGRLLGNDTDGEVDDVSTTTEGGGGSVDDVSTTTEGGGGSVG